MGVHVRSSSGLCCFFSDSLFVTVCVLIVSLFFLLLSLSGFAGPVSCTVDHMLQPQSPLLASGLWTGIVGSSLKSKPKPWNLPITLGCPGFFTCECCFSRLSASKQAQNRWHMRGKKRERNEKSGPGSRCFWERSLLLPSRQKPQLIVGCMIR